MPYNVGVCPTLRCHLRCRDNEHIACVFFKKLPYYGGGQLVPILERSLISGRQRIMWKSCIANIIVLCFAQVVCAERLQIVGKTWFAGSASSCSVILEVENNGPHDVLLGSWQLVCQIIPVGDSPTDAFFTGLTDYTPASDFVFGNKFFGVFRNPDNQLGTPFYAFSTDPNGGVDVQPPNTNLLLFDLTSPNAVGTFDIALAAFTEPDIGSYWSDNNGNAHTFDIAPPPGRPSEVVATVVFSDVPEPSTGFIMLLGMISSILFWFTRRRH